MPDGIAMYEADGKTYLVTANEGDAREWGDEEASTDFCNEIKETLTAADGTEAKKVRVIDPEMTDGMPEGKSVLFSSRSFSIYRVDEDGLTQVFDSGKDFEALTARYIPEYFNCSNDDNDYDSRSPKKGPEPENVTVGAVNGQLYAFVGLERIGGIMVYRIDNENAAFVNYINTRDFSENPGEAKPSLNSDVAPEGLCFIPSSGILLAAFEVSGTVSAYSVAESAKQPTIFEDVDAAGIHKDYAEAIAWAASEEITLGVDDFHFNPDGTCTRGEAVTFLWRASGKPAPSITDTAFEDLDDSAFYYDAVLWAFENDITNGTSETTFSPNEVCNRAQIVTFLWRANGESAPASSDCRFTDVEDGSFYCDAVQWAFENGITKGTGETTFTPAAPCTRAQTVTFLFRARP